MHLGRDPGAGANVRGAPRRHRSRRRSRGRKSLQSRDCAAFWRGCASSGTPPGTALRADPATTTAPAGRANTRERCRAGRRPAAAVGDRSPPAASSPAGSSSACSSGGNHSRSPSGESQVMVLFMPFGSRARTARVAIRHVRVDLARVCVHVRAFAPQIVADGRAEARIDDPVRRPGERAARTRGSPCARPACRARSADARARCRIRCPGDSRSRNAGCGTARWRPSSGRTACRRSRRTWRRHGLARRAARASP